MLRMSMKLDTFIWWFYLVIMNKSTSIYQNILGDNVNLNMKIRKTRKVNLVPMLWQEKLADLFLMLSPGQLRMQPKGFHWYSFIKTFQK